MGTPGDGSATKQAFASRLAEAADSVREYGKRVAQVASFTAPLNTVQQAVTNNSTQLMPTAAADQLLQSGQGIRLLPSEQDYKLAGSTGQSTKDAIGKTPTRWRRTRRPKRAATPNISSPSARSFPAWATSHPTAPGAMAARARAARLRRTRFWAQPATGLPK
jgi:hypothetical protein